MSGSVTGIWLMFNHGRRFLIQSKHVYIPVEIPEEIIVTLENFINMQCIHH